MSKLKTYTSSEAVYVDGVLYKAGDPFSTDKPVGSTWSQIGGAEKAAIEAGKEIKDDVDFSALTVSELRSAAAALGINVGEAKTKTELLAVIAARDVPQM